MASSYFGVFILPWHISHSVPARALNRKQGLLFWKCIWVRAKGQAAVSVDSGELKIGARLSPWAARAPGTAHPPACWAVSCLLEGEPPLAWASCWFSGKAALGQAGQLVSGGGAVGKACARTAGLSTPGSSDSSPRKAFLPPQCHLRDTLVVRVAAAVWGEQGGDGAPVTTQRKERSTFRVTLLHFTSRPP